MAWKQPPNHKRLAWHRWEIKDGFDQSKWTAFTISVFAPSYEHPYASVLVSIANGGGRVLMRLRTVSDAQSLFAIPGEIIDRLNRAVEQGEIEAQAIERDMRLALERRNLPAGTGLARTDTGQIVAEAERIIGGR